MTGAELKAALKRIGWSQAEAGRRVGVGEDMVSRWARGLAPVPPYAAALIGVSLDLLALAEKHVHPTKLRGGRRD